MFSQNYWIALVNAWTNNSFKAKIALETEIGYGDEWVSFRLHGYAVSMSLVYCSHVNPFSPTFKMSIHLADCEPYSSFNVCSENLVVHQYIQYHLILLTCLVDNVLVF